MYKTSKGIISKYRELKERIKYLKKYKDKESSFQNDYDSDIKKCENELNKIKKKIALRMGIAGIAIFGAITLSAIGFNSSNFHDNESVSFSDTLMEESDSYNSFKKNLSKFIELSKKENLTENEKNQLKYLKSLIQSNPEGITSYALYDVLKPKLASSLNVDDSNRITIVDKSSDVKISQNIHQNGYKTDIRICVDGKTKASFEQFASLSDGSVQIYSNTIPENVLNVIYSIEEAQKNSDNYSSAIKALKDALNLPYKCFDVSHLGDEDMEH